MESEIKLLIQENSRLQDLLVYTDCSVTKSERPVRVGFHCHSVRQGATTIHEDNAAYTVSTSSLTVEVGAVTHVLDCLKM